MAAASIIDSSAKINRPAYARMRLRRTRWHHFKEGSQTPTEALLDEAERAISEGVREIDSLLKV